MNNTESEGQAVEELPDAEGETVTLVFADSTTSTVPRQTLLKSPFFTIALQPRWSQGKAGTIKLLDDDPDIIAYYTTWLDAAILPRATYLVLAKLYVLGEKFMDCAFKNAVVLAILLEKKEGRRLMEFSEAVEIMYEGTMAGSLGRMLLVDMFYWREERSWFQHFEDLDDLDYHQLFVDDLEAKSLEINDWEMDIGLFEAKRYLENVE